MQNLDVIGIVTAGFGVSTVDVFTTGGAIHTEWVEFKELASKLVDVAGKEIFVIDANRHLQDVVVSLGLEYSAVGMPSTNEVG